jgi:hypothetical protein
MAGEDMEFEPAIVLELEAIEGLSSKVFPLVATEGVAAPYIAYVSSEGLRDKSLTGYMESKAIDVELNIMARTYKEMKHLTKTVLDKVIGFQSRAIGEVGPFIQELTYQKPVELYEHQPKLHRCVIDITFYI